LAVAVCSIPLFLLAGAGSFTFNLHTQC
jgi:hypothetical protein